MKIELRSETPEETRAVGEAIASLFRAGDVVALTGELGAGKTTFVQGAARALGVTRRVVSPTFTLHREYPGRMPVHHVDVYRLERVQEVLDLGLEEILEGEGVLFVEWGDMIEALLPEAHLQVEFSDAGASEGRRLLLTGSGYSWASRWERLEQLTEPWETGL